MMLDITKIPSINDKINNRIAEVNKNNDDFEFAIKTLCYLHRALFNGIYYRNGSFREYDDPFKREPSLYGERIKYAGALVIPSLLNYELKKEKQVDYSKLTPDQIATNIAKFAAEIWRIHPFVDGNTRVTSIFIEKYLKSMGYNIDSEQGKKYGDYYRDALVRANYSSEKYGIKKDLKPLIKFYKKLLFNPEIELNDEDLYIHGLLNQILYEAGLLNQMSYEGQFKRKKQK